jgi:ABC-type phosphate transport system permease subunit
MNALWIVPTVLVGLFLLLFTVYFFNLDMKLVGVIYRALGRHYDKMKRKTAL